LPSRRADPLRGLNPEQRTAVTTTEGPLLVLAGAGTGKTRVITVRIAHLLQRGVPARAILAMTFTNKAAGEMKERVGSLVGAKKGRELTIGTFHSFCVRALRTHARELDLPPHFSICDEADRQTAIRGVMRDLHVPDARLHPRVAQARISLLKNRLVSADDLLDAPGDETDDLLARVYRRYDEHLRRSRSLDFDDLLLFAVRLLREREKVRRAFSERYRYVMVDEYQDTNGPQYEIVRLIARDHGNLCVVGDDDQSIYGWRGADVSKILNFEKDFRGAKVVRLETNYRSTPQILEAANNVIRHNLSRHGKTLRSASGEGVPIVRFEAADEEDEADYVTEEIAREVGGRRAAFGDFAILVRTQMQPRAFEAALRGKRIPYVLVGGTSFFDRKEVRDLLAYLRVVANPDDEVSFLRIVNCPPRGIGKTTVDRVLAFATREGISASRAFDRLGEIDRIPETAARASTELRAILRHLARLQEGDSLVRLVSNLVRDVRYREEVDRCYPDAMTRESRWAAVVEVINFAENFVRRAERPTLTGFLEELALTANDDRTSEDSTRRNAVTLMTLHAAKGLEFPRVYLVGMEEGFLPHEKSVEEDTVEEERRLAYVGITRAREHLTVTHARERARYGKRTERSPSRFLIELAGRGEDGADDGDLVVKRRSTRVAGEAGGSSGVPHPRERGRGPSPASSRGGSAGRPGRRAAGRRKVPPGARRRKR
jgi:superfamily I DNA/RNA helicase